MAGHHRRSRRVSHLRAAACEYAIAAPAIPALSTGDEILMMTESYVRGALDEVPVVSRTVANDPARQRVG
jgi:hypothetical protein